MEGYQEGGRGWKGGLIHLSALWLKSTLNILHVMLLLALLGLNHGNLMESLENITKSDSKSHPTFVDHPLLPGMNFNGHCLTKNTFIPKKSKKSISFLHIRSTINKFKHRFYIK